MCSARCLLLNALILTVFAMANSASIQRHDRWMRPERGNERLRARTVTKSHNVDARHCSLLRVRASRRAVLGGPAVVLHCGLEGLRGDAVEWYFEGRSLRERHPNRYLKLPGKRERFGRYERMRNGNLRIYDVRRHDAGLYVCREKRKSSEDTPKRCRATRFIVIFPPIVDREMYRKRVLAYGKLSKVRCKVHGYPAPRISWLKDGKPIVFGQHPRYNQTIDGSLLISKTAWNDSGLFTCIADNSRAGGGRAQVDISVVVASPESYLAKPPVIIKPPRNRRVRLGSSNLVLTCAATGGPYTDIQWSFVSENGSWQPSALHHKRLLNPHRHEIPTTVSQLHLARFTRNHVGKYKCTARNLAGTAVATSRIRLRGES